jgi:hypothetical protein
MKYFFRDLSSLLLTLSVTDIVVRLLSVTLLCPSLTSVGTGRDRRWVARWVVHPMRVLNTPASIAKLKILRVTGEILYAAKITRQLDGNISDASLSSYHPDLSVAY